jgi:hypothetical protein
MSIAFPDLHNVSRDVLRKCRKEAGLHFLAMRAEFHMTEENKARRVRSGQLPMNANRDWRNVIFTDESWFELGQHKRWVWRRHDDYGADVCYSRHSDPADCALVDEMPRRLRQVQEDNGRTIQRLMVRDDE